VRRSADRGRIREALAFLGHPEIPLDVPVGRLSVGARQIVEIARAILERERLPPADRVRVLSCRRPGRAGAGGRDALRHAPGDRATVGARRAGVTRARAYALALERAAK
jgi:hypothetical protein